MNGLFDVLRARVGVIRTATGSDSSDDDDFEEDTSKRVTRSATAVALLKVPGKLTKQDNSAVSNLFASRAGVAGTKSVKIDPARIASFAKEHAKVYDKPSKGSTIVSSSSNIENGRIQFTQPFGSSSSTPTTAPPMPPPMPPPTAPHTAPPPPPPPLPPPLPPYPPNNAKKNPVAAISFTPPPPLTSPTKMAAPAPIDDKLLAAIRTSVNHSRLREAILAAEDGRDDGYVHPDILGAIVHAFTSNPSPETIAPRTKEDVVIYEMYFPSITFRRWKGADIKDKKQKAEWMTYVNDINAQIKATPTASVYPHIPTAEEEKKEQEALDQIRANLEAKQKRVQAAADAAKEAARLKTEAEDKALAEEEAKAAAADKQAIQDKRVKLAEAQRKLEEEQDKKVTTETTADAGVWGSLWNATKAAGSGAITVGGILGSSAIAVSGFVGSGVSKGYSAVKYLRASKREHIENLMDEMHATAVYNDQSALLHSAVATADNDPDLLELIRDIFISNMQDVNNVVNPVRVDDEYGKDLLKLFPTLSRLAQTSNRYNKSELEAALVDIASGRVAAAAAAASALPVPKRKLAKFDSSGSDSLHPLYSLMHDAVNESTYDAFHKVYMEKLMSLSLDIANDPSKAHLVRAIQMMIAEEDRIMTLEQAKHKTRAANNMYIALYGMAMILV